MSDLEQWREQRLGKLAERLDGKELTLAKNEGGVTHLHGGNVGFDRKLWDVTPIEGICEDSLILKYTSPDGEEGYPGTLKVMVTYTFNDFNELSIHYEAVSDKDTLCNLTNHTYFNLAGEGSGTIEDHIIEINADTFTVVSDKKCIPTGEMRPVGGTPFDLREPKRIGDGMALTDKDEQLTYGNGYDHNFILGDPGVMRIAAEVCEPETGRVMTVKTDKPAIQFYIGIGLDGENGKNGKKYNKYAGLCLESQFSPDTPNKPQFPTCVYKAGQTYRFTTVYEFSVR